LHNQPQATMYKFVVLACAVAAVAAEADPTLAYAGGLAYAGNLGYAGLAHGAYALPNAGYGYAAGLAPYHGLNGYTAGYGYAAQAIPAPAAAVAPVVPKVVAPVAASAYALPAVRTVAEAPIVETVVEPVEQWGYKVAY